PAMDVTYVIARYKEDISWSDSLNRVVIQKDTDLPNLGREISSFLYFIVTNYERLEGEYIFCQGNPLPHAPDVTTREFGKRVTCKADGSPQHKGLPIHEVCRALDLPLLEEYT